MYGLLRLKIVLKVKKTNEKGSSTIYKKSRIINFLSEMPKK